MVDESPVMRKCEDPLPVISLSICVGLGIPLPASHFKPSVIRGFPHTLDQSLVRGPHTSNHDLKCENPVCVYIYVCVWGDPLGNDCENPLPVIDLKCNNLV